VGVLALGAGRRALGGSGGPPADAQGSTAGLERKAPVQIVLVRHAEKEAGGTQDPGLSAAGRERARLLAHMLSRAGVDVLFATDTRRARETVEPLAEAHGLEVTTYDAADAAGFAQRLAELPGGSVAVVVGHSNTLGPLAEVLAGALSDLEQGRLSEDEYDRLVVVVLPAGDGPGALLELRYGEKPAPR
jgi:broad specificity phosphatase PhoE